MNPSAITIEIPAELYADLEALTEETQAKDPVDMIARLVTQAHQKRAEVYATTPAFQRVLDRATDLGVSDLSEQHDHYLSGTDKN
jgi:hypothetical protein